MNDNDKSTFVLLNKRIKGLVTLAITVIVILLTVCMSELVVYAFLAKKLDSPSIPVMLDPIVTHEAEDTTGSSPADTSESTTVPATEDTTTTAYITIDLPKNARLGETSDFGQEYIDKIIFLGDSTSYGLQAYAMLKDGKDTKQVWTGKAGYLNLAYNITTTSIVYPDTGESMTIAEAAALKKPEYMVITLGIDYGVAYCGEDEFKLYYSRLLDDITNATPTTKIILQSIYPVATNNNISNITNNKIDLCNLWIEELAEDYGLKYLNTNPSLKGEDGYLIYSYQNGDGLHMNQYGYAAVLDYIKTHGYTND